MSVLTPQPFSVLMRRLIEEPRHQGGCFDLPWKKWWSPRRDPVPELGVRVHGCRAATPIGPAAGPHTQMAQNLVLGWLAGARFFELKTIQLLDQLDIPRPCMDMRNLGFNVEWSQELRLEQSVREYTAGALLIAIAKAADIPRYENPKQAEEDDVVFDLSVGYDLKGVQSDRMVQTIRSLQQAGPMLDALRREIPAEYAAFRDVPCDPILVRTVTLSTFHGCPPEEIEGIATFLMEEFGLHTVVKLNPTLLGRERLQELLHATLSYDTLRVPESAFTQDLQWADSLDLARRLESVARRRGLHCGFKFTNTLITENDEGPLPRSQPHRYMSGAPLHVLALTLADQWRRAADWKGPVSFSAGVDRANVADVLACGFAPITICTDLLKLGGYGRMPAYLEAIAARMSDVGAADISDFILRAEGNAAGAVREVLRAEQSAPGWRIQPDEQNASGDARRLESARCCIERIRRLNELLPADTPKIIPETLFGPEAKGQDWNAVTPARQRILEAFLDEVTARAAMLNARTIAERVRKDPRYRRENNSAEPRKTEARLDVFDCLNCDKCISACPNDAIFSYEIEPEQHTSAEIALTPSGEASSRLPAREFSVRKPRQIAVFADWCNECGNCQTACPEQGAPFAEKPNFIGTLADWKAQARENSYCYEPSEMPGGIERIHGRIGGKAYCLIHRPGDREALLTDARSSLRLRWPDGIVLAGGGRTTESEGHCIPLEVFYRLRILLDGIVRGQRVNSIHVRRPRLS